MKRVRHFLAPLATAVTLGTTLTANAAAATPVDPSADRPAGYLGLLLTGAMVHEDRDNRLTHRRRSAIAVPGLALRAGGVVGKRHLVGALFQADWRSTKMVRDGQGGDRRWGAITSYWLGPEYRFATSFGLYAGGSLGFVYTFADNDTGGGGSPDCNRWSCLVDHMRRTDDRGVPGVGARATVGYEWRLRRMLAVSTEAFASIRHGRDEHGVAMTLPSYGVAVGVGF